ncbi:MAG: hypothetical protein PHP93_04770 [Kiritimatiellales bacterium]|nr:hypothetical protein [Kiritimatiellales bacterium]
MRNHIFFSIVGLTVLLSAMAQALMAPIATDTLVDLSSCIVEGQVTGLSSRWTADGSLIVTEVMVEVTDALLGETNRVTFLYEGGVVGDVGLRVSDMPAVSTNQQVLVFLRKMTDREKTRDISSKTGFEQRYMLSGSAQGFCRIENGRAIKGNFTVLETPAAGAKAVASNDVPMAANDSSVVEHNVDLTDLKKRIRQRLKEAHTP